MPVTARRRFSPATPPAAIKSAGIGARPPPGISGLARKGHIPVRSRKLGRRLRGLLRPS